jgi:capsular polysaccharide biosynthesis protein
MHSTWAYFLLALAVGTGFGVAVAFAAEYFDPTVRTPHDVEALLDIPVLAWLPETIPQRHRSARSPAGRRKVVG